VRLTRTSDLWWKSAVVYCLDVETFQDSDGDGHGDFRGLIQRIDHLQRLGVTCMWLMPCDPGSLLGWIRLLIECYRACPELAWGRYEVLDADDTAVLAHRCDTEGAAVVAVHNFGAASVQATLKLTGLDASCLLEDVLAGGSQRVEKDGSVTLELGRYGCRWLLVKRPRR
jgi:hypothetical protein